MQRESIINCVYAKTSQKTESDCKLQLKCKKSAIITAYMNFNIQWPRKNQRGRGIQEKPKIARGFQTIKSEGQGSDLTLQCI